MNTGTEEPKDQSKSLAEAADTRTACLADSVEVSRALLDKVAKCKVRLNIKSVFYGNLAMGMDWVACLSMYGMANKTMATDGISIFWNPGFVEGMTLDEFIGVTAHEVAHKVLKHHLRIRGRDPLIWNVATDYAINKILVDDGFVLPKDALLNSKYDGWNAEKIYIDLMKDQSKKNIKQQAWGNFIEPKNPDGSSKSSEEMSAEGQKVDGQARAAAAAGKLAGNQPGNLVEMVNKSLEPDIDYDEIIWKVFTGHGLPEYSMRRPSKSILSNYDMFSVGHDSTGAGIIGIGADVSGSIGTIELMHILGIINSVIEQTGPEKIVVVQFDHQVSSVIEYDGDSALPDFKVTGRGGTDFSPQFKAIEDSGLHIDQYLVITDGYGPFPDKAPDYPVTWLMTTDVRAPWGTTVPFRLKGINQ